MTTGAAPQASASIKLIEAPSLNDVSANTSSERYTSTGRSTQPGKRTRSLTPHCRAHSASACRSDPSPQITRYTGRFLTPLGPMSATASIMRSYAFTGSSRPTLPTTIASRGIASRSSSS